MQGSVHIVRIVGHHDKLIVRIVTAKFFYRFQDIACCLHHIGIAVLVNQHIDCRFSIQTPIALLTGILLPHCGHGRQRNQFSPAVLYPDFFNICGLTVFGHHPHIGFCRLRIYRSGRQQLIFVADSTGDFGQSQLIGSEFIPIHFHGYFLIPATMQLDFRNAARLLQNILKDIFRHGIGIAQAMLTHDRQFHDGLGVNIPLYHHRCVGLIG